MVEWIAEEQANRHPKRGTARFSQRLEMKANRLALRIEFASVADSDGDGFELAASENLDAYRAVDWREADFGDQLRIVVNTPTIEFQNYIAHLKV